MAILSFSDKDTEDLFYGGCPSAKAPWKSISKVALRKLDLIDYAQELRDLMAPPGNRLEELKGNLAGHFSIRINSQWRVVFVWTSQGARDVRIMDYH